RTLTGPCVRADENQPGGFRAERTQLAQEVTDSDSPGHLRQGARRTRWTSSLLPSLFLPEAGLSLSDRLDLLVGDHLRQLELVVLRHPCEFEKILLPVRHLGVAKQLLRLVCQLLRDLNLLLNGTRCDASLLGRVPRKRRNRFAVFRPTPSLGSR